MTARGRREREVAEEQQGAERDSGGCSGRCRAPLGSTRVRWCVVVCSVVVVVVCVVVCVLSAGVACWARVCCVAVSRFEGCGNGWPVAQAAAAAAATATSDARADERHERRTEGGGEEKGREQERAAATSMEQAHT